MALMLTRSTRSRLPAAVAGRALLRTSAVQGSSSSSASGKDGAEAAEKQHDKTGKGEKVTAGNKRAMTQREKDLALQARLKARMSLEGDELYEDGQPVESGMRRNVKRNMFRLI